MDSRRLRQFRRHRRLQGGDPTPPGRERHYAGTYPIRRTRGHARGSSAALPICLRPGGNARPRSLDRTALPRPRWRYRSLGAPFLAYRTSDGNRNAVDDLDLRDQGRAAVRAPPGRGNAEPAADAGLRSRILPRFRHLDDGGGARSASPPVSSPAISTYPSTTRQRRIWAAARRMLGAKSIYPAPDGWNSIPRTGSSAIATSSESRSRAMRGRPFPCTASITAIARTKREWSSRSGFEAWERAPTRESRNADRSRLRHHFSVPGADADAAAAQHPSHARRRPALARRHLFRPILRHARLSRSFRQSRHARRGSRRPRYFSQSLPHSRFRPARRNPPRCRAVADRPASRRSAAVPGFEPLLRQRQSRRFRVVEVPHDNGRLAPRAGDLRLRPWADPLQLPRGAPHPHRQRRDARRCGRLPRFRPSRRRALSLHEHPGPLLHGVSRRHRRPDRSQSDGFQRMVRGVSRRALVHNGRAPQPSAYRPDRHVPRPRRRRRRDLDRFRPRQSHSVRRGDERTPGRGLRARGGAERGNGWFGGLLPPIAIALVAATGNIYAGLWYPIAIAAMTFIVGLIFIPETKNVDINHN